MAATRNAIATPVINTPIKPVFDTGDPGDPAESDETDEPPPDVVPEQPTPPDAVDGQLDPPALPKPPPPPHHGRFGVTLGLGLGSSLIGNRDIAARGLFVLDLHGGGFVGPKRRFLLAALKHGREDPTRLDDGDQNGGQRGTAECKEQAQQRAKHGPLRKDPTKAGTSSRAKGTGDPLAPYPLPLIPFPRDRPASGCAAS